MDGNDTVSYRVKALDGGTRLITQAQLERINEINQKLKRKPIKVIEVVPNT